jgi:arginyl-tRNA synthetase
VGGKCTISTVYQVYVEVNRKAESDESVASEAKRLFAQLESGDVNLTQQWSIVCEVTVEALKAVYSRLGIRFDHYHGEAMYGTSKVTRHTVSEVSNNFFC